MGMKKGYGSMKKSKRGKSAENCSKFRAVNCEEKRLVAPGPEKEKMMPRDSDDHRTEKTCEPLILLSKVRNNAKKPKRRRHLGSGIGTDSRVLTASDGTCWWRTARSPCRPQRTRTLTDVARWTARRPDDASGAGPSDLSAGKKKHGQNATHKHVILDSAMSHI